MSEEGCLIRHCEICGKEFVAKRKTARFCSSTCRSRYFRAHRGQPVSPLELVEPVFNIPRETVEKTIQDAHALASDLSRASMHTPSPLCLSLSRIAACLDDALRSEGL